MSPRRRELSDDQVEKNVAFLRAVGTALRKRRQARGMTQLQLAFECKVQPSYLSAIENGQKNPTMVTLWRVSLHLGTELSDIIEEAGY